MVVVVEPADVPDRFPSDLFRELAYQSLASVSPPAGVRAAAQVLGSSMPGAAHAAVRPGHLHDGVRGGRQPPVALPAVGVVGRRVARLHLELGGRPGRPDHAVPPPAAAEHRRQPVAGITVLRPARGPATASTRGIHRASTMSRPGCRSRRTGHTSRRT